MKLDVSVSAALGVAFVVLATANTYLMFKLWSYPFDKATKTSAAPRSLMLVHRATGYVYAGIYVLLMTQMVPRLFSYQVEFPARTVAHIMLGITIGVILFLKISIMRWYRHFEEWMPYLGVSLLLFTWLLAGLSLPFSYKEQMLAAHAARGGDVYGDANAKRIRELLPAASFPKEAALDQLASPRTLRQGREVLLRECVVCHDLKTILMRPRTPADWWRTVQRMSDKPVLDEEISPRQQWAVTAYLIAISPELQQQAKRQRERQNELQKARANAATAEIKPPADFDPHKAKKVFEQACSQCHDTSDVDEEPPKSDHDIKQLMARMVDNGLELSPPETVIVEVYMQKKYVLKQ